jgi:branched-chain amino acid transport system ATP-binding protein
MSELLRVDGLRVAYGHIEAVRGVGFALREGEITALVGANGAGKSTTLLALSGLIPAAGGTALFDGADLLRLPSHAIVRRGVVQVAEGRAMLGTLSVRENLLLGAYGRKDKADVAADLEQAVVRFPVLGRRIDALAGNLSGGEQQMLAIARALMARPRLLLLDEPSMGLAPLLVQEIFAIVADIHRAGMSILLVEQNVRQALKIAQQGYVIENGAIALDGSGEALLRDPAVVAAYLGG